MGYRHTGHSYSDMYNVIPFPTQGAYIPALYHKSQISYIYTMCMYICASESAFITSCTITHQKRDPALPQTYSCCLTCRHIHVHVYVRTVQCCILYMYTCTCTFTRWYTHMYRVHAASPLYKIIHTRTWISSTLVTGIHVQKQVRLTHTCVSTLHIA